MASVVHLKRREGVVVQDCDIYIGRAMYQGGWRLPGSKWANPFRLDPASGNSRPRVLEAYERHLRGSPALMAALPELRGARLGCWCAPLACHGDILIKLLNEVDPPPHDTVRDETTAVKIPDEDPIWDELGV